MGKLLALAMLVALLAPASALADAANRGQCRRITRQIAQFENTLALAKERDDDLWADATEAHITRLGERRARLCPEYRPPNQVVEWMRTFRDWTRVAAKAAVKYFTGQWF